MFTPSWRKFWPYVALLAVVLLFFRRLVFTNLILARGDTFLYFYPYWQLARDALLDGRLPLWNPSIFMGAPLLANSQMGFFYPLNWPLWALLEVPYAVSAAVVIHVVIAGWGMIALARRALGLSETAAFLAGLGLACGGYLTAQIEHVNQLQGLAWLPWLLLVGDGGQRDQGIQRKILWLGVLFGFQLLAGHTQSVFISGVALGVWELGRWDIAGGWRRAAADLWARLWPLAAGGGVGLLLAAVQLLPTLELTQLSSRAGGLTTNEIVSFSWHPLLVPRSLLPTPGQSIFTEYVAFLPLTFWVLALLAVLGGGRLARWRPPLLLAGVGFWLALGRFGGLYLILGSTPGFDLFRVPARWLIVAMIGVCLLAAAGFDQLRSELRSRRPLQLAFAGVLLLIVAQFPAAWLSRWCALGPEAPAAWPTTAALVWQAIELSLIGVWLWTITGRRSGHFYGVIPIGSSIIALWWTAQLLPYNNPTTPEAYFDQRPPSLRLQVENSGRIPPQRFLSLSNIFFDPGDQAEIDIIYDDILSSAALYDYTIAIKLKEIVAPNLGAVYGLPSIDGFDGGILPLSSYSDLMARTMLDGQTTTDGRLREFLAAVPDPHWLSLFGVGYVITDKVGDAWVDGVYFDQQLPHALAAGEAEAISFVPDMASTALWLISDDGPGAVEVKTAEGVTLTAEPIQNENGVWVASWSEERSVTGVVLRAGAAPWTIKAVTLVNELEQTFFPLVMGPFHLIHSGDVKIYEFAEPLPRAVALAAGATVVLDNVRLDVVPQITSYEPEQVVIEVDAPEPLRLVLLDASYPGWNVRVNGRPADVLLIDGFFRGVDVPAGSSTVDFRFQPRPVRRGLWLSGISLLGWLGAFAVLIRQRKNDGQGVRG